MLDTKLSFDKFMDHLNIGYCLWDTIHFHQFRIDKDQLIISYNPDDSDLDESVSISDLKQSIEYSPDNLSFKSELFDSIFLDGTVQVLGVIIS